MSYGRRYGGDPYWLTVRYPGKCAKCGTTIGRGAQAFRYKDGSLYCEAAGCGGAESSSFEAAAFDEAVTTGNW